MNKISILNDADFLEFVNNVYLLLFAEYFGLGSWGEEGCIACFCSGHTKNCTSAEGWYSTEYVNSWDLTTDITATQVNREPGTLPVRHSGKQKTRHSARQALR